MKFTYNDLTDSSTLVFKQLQKLTEKAERLEAQAKRIRRLDCNLTYLIQYGKITDTEDIDCAIAWLEHSDLSVEDIISKIGD